MQAKVLSDEQWQKIFKKMNDPYLSILKISLLTACRSCEVLQLRVENCYENGKPLDFIHFPKDIRKGKRKDLILPVSENLRVVLLQYQQPESGYLFPSKYSGCKRVSYESYNLKLKTAAKLCGISGKISTHSARRSTLTKLNNQGFSLAHISKISGHSSLASLQRYLDVSEKDINLMVNAI